MSYHFLDLSPTDKALRRESLDFYAQVAQLSVLVPLFWLQIYYLFLWARRRYLSDFDSGDTFGKSATLRGNGDGGLLWKWRLWWRRAEWWMGGRVSERWTGSVWGRVGAWMVGEARWGEVVVGCAWGVWLGVCCFVGTGQDYMHLTKRFGIVGASQLPFHYLLALKSPYSPLQTLTRQSWEALNTLHQLLGNIITILFYLHTAFYLNYFIQVHVLINRLGRRDVILGLIAILAFTIIGTTSLSWLRKWNYRVFFFLHVTLATILLPVLFFHVHHIRLYIWETLAILSINFLSRALHTRLVSATVAVVPNTHNQLLSITIPHSQPQRRLNWEPGQHVYISAPHSSPFLSLLPTRSRNPFTIVSAQSSLHLIARVHSGATTALASTVYAAFPKPAVVPLNIEGPYGLSTHSLALLSYNRVLFVAGGVGATFVVPLYRALLNDLSPSRGSRRREGVKFVWVVRDIAETAWAGDPILISKKTESGEVPEQEDAGASKIDDDGFWDRINIFVTGDSNSARRNQSHSSLRRPSAHDTEDDNDNDQDVEMEQLLSPPTPISTPNNTPNHNLSVEQDTSSTHPLQPPSSDIRPISISQGRPNLKSLVHETFYGANTNPSTATVFSSTAGHPSLDVDAVSDSPTLDIDDAVSNSSTLDVGAHHSDKANSSNDDNRVAIFVCGPKALAKDLRREVGVYVEGGQWDIWFWNEEFGL